MKSEYHPQHAPQRRIRDADRGEPDPERYAEAQPGPELHQQIAADPLGGFVHRGCRAVKIVGAGEPKHPVPKVLALEEHQHDEKHDKTGMHDREQHRPNHRLQDVERAGRALSNHHRYRRGSLPGRSVDGQRCTIAGRI